MCTEQGCQHPTMKSFLTQGPAFRHRSCQACYNRIRQPTLRTIYKGRDPPGWSEWWESNTVFMGNLPYDATDEEVAAWVHEQVFPDRDPYPYFFRVRCNNGGRPGNYEVWKKVFKRFAFVEFTFARDAKCMLEMLDKDEPDKDKPDKTFRSRRTTIRPCVVRVSWQWYKKKEWVRCQDYVPVDDVR